MWQYADYVFSPYSWICDVNRAMFHNTIDPNVNRVVQLRRDQRVETVRQFHVVDDFQNRFQLHLAGRWVFRVRVQENVHAHVVIGERVGEGIPVRFPTHAEDIIVLGRDNSWRYSIQAHCSVEKGPG